MEEEDTCRICRSGPEEDMPLYHPCKCSGSIAKVHQDCLIDWLQHSKKKSCELCNTQLRFHKVYSPTMPAKLPAYLYIRRFLYQSLLGLRFLLRSIIVGLSWCALLPLLNLGVWRLHFMVVDHVIWGLIGGAPPSTRLTASLISNTTINATQPSSSLIAPSPTPSALATAPHANTSISSSMSGLTFRGFGKNGMFIPLLFNTTANATYNTLDHLAQDTFEGQMLTCAIILFFVAIFLLREWCLQNLPQNMPDPVEGVAFAPAPQAAPRRPQAIMPEPVLPAGLDWQVPDNEQAGAGPLPPPVEEGAERPEITRGGDGSADHSPRMRPRLRHGVPDPPELQVLASRHDNGEGSSLQRDDETSVEPLSIEEMRRRRAERFGSSLQNGKLPEREGQLEQSFDILDPRDIGNLKEKLDDAEEDNALDVGKGKFIAMGEEELGGEDDEVWQDSHALPDQAPGEITQDHEMIPIEAALREKGGTKGDGEDTPISVSSSAGQAAEEEGGEETERDEAVGGEALGEGEVAEHGVEDHALEVRNDQVAAPVEPVNDVHGWEDDIDNGDRLEDDMDGMLEAIGLQGPLINLFTNMLMMFVLCSFVLVIAVALPYLIGRVFGVGSNFFKFVSLPVKGLRFFTDPLVDYIVYKGAKGIERAMQTSFLRRAAASRAVRTVARCSRMTNGSVWYQQAILRLSQISKAASATAVDTSKAASDHVVNIVSKETPRSREALEASIVALRCNLQSQYQHLSASLYKLYIKAEAKTQGVNQDDKMFCVLLGHLYWLIGLFVQKRLSSLYLRWNLKWLKTTVDQQLVVFKVLAFIVLELAIFPWCCGVLLDVSLLPLWQDVSLSSRYALIKSKPLSVGFTQWSLGTLYMFALAQFVSSTRSIVRPGVLCFVRDAGDPGFHPIKDILERKSGEQLRKIGVSGIIYSGILAATIGFCSYGIYFADRQARIFPLRWEMHQSLTTTGFEYVFIAVALPPIIKAWLPTSLLKKAVKAWWKLMARQLRISSYLIGGPFEDERGHYVGKTWWRAVLGYRRADSDNEQPVTLVHDGGYGRVPADDQAIMSSPIVIRTDESGEPITERGREAMQQQQEAIDKTTKKPQYTVVYLPPHFRPRIIALLVALWASISMSFLVTLLLPLLTGRMMIDCVLIKSDLHPPLHDGYSWLFGIISIGGAAQLAKAARRLTKSSRPSRRLSKMARRVAEYAWMFFFVSFTGCLLGICVELYINGLTRPFTSPKTATLPDISVFHTWCTGVLLQFTVAQLLEVRGPLAPLDWDKMPKNGASAFYAILDLRSNNMRRPKVWLLTKRGFLPSIIIYLYAIVAPFTLVFGIQLAFGKASTKEGQSLQMYLAFMICLKSLWIGLLMKALGRVADRWTALIRDEVFLISTQLKNCSSDDHKKPTNGTGDPHVADGPIPDALLNR